MVAKRKAQATPLYTENDIEICLKAYNEDPSLTIKSAAKLKSIPYNAFRDRVNGKKSRVKSHQHLQLFTAKQENEISAYLRASNDKHEGLSSAEVIKYAQNILKQIGKDEKIGKNWFNRFLKRQKFLSSIRASTFEDSRSLSCGRDKLKKSTTNQFTKKKTHSLNFK
ncbi:hypothetical protein KGF54_004882 [Candida jiufengensis]|uniref:uncharacterized protein n=1 Tax=Candida jiufengensis TaxID=497108 RepID=UPI0022246CB1|nr:uncharacterized protein KGF54_004882 [Candida jiufengensis]KAI5951807.1 hypothetical protein KGF54_004882 [Candida jiufengensis]